MWPSRLLLLICFTSLAILSTFYSLLHSHARHSAVLPSAVSHKGRLRALFSFHTPESLFPPSAIISLTDDNSTFFLARPAAFGPSLPSDGLSGQVWIGSGFGDNSLAKGSAFIKAEGELGCGDIPGWLHTKLQELTPPSTKSQAKAKHVASEPRAKLLKTPKDRATKEPKDPALPAKSKQDDGTDDHLHHSLVGVSTLKGQALGKASHDDAQNKHRPGHADIQSLQESAEIAGKVVLLSRGGCGFLEKVKWVQRRGGMALIVGDDEPGGPLVNMYAHGDTSNVTVPALFTTYTSAHLLASLMSRKGGFIGGIPLRDDLTPEARFSRSTATNKGRGGFRGSSDGPLPTPAHQPKSTNILHAVDSAKTAASSGSDPKPTKVNWVKALGRTFGIGRSASADASADSVRYPSSGRINWVKSENWNDEPLPAKQSKDNLKGSTDDFVIGVQDWRDPDLLGTNQDDSLEALAGDHLTSPESNAPEVPAGNGLMGGSITPGSGQYAAPDSTKSSASQAKTSEPETPSGKDPTREVEPTGWFKHIFAGTGHNLRAPPRFMEEIEFQEADESSLVHDGLWVTMTPTTMSTSPFFDTLLVLVVSPLVTLIVVYALLLLRSRIQRRRWRAPKSVVDRLPVRTYHTMSSSTSSLAPSLHGSSPNSPLLQSNARASLSHPLPRSHTASGIGESAAASPEMATAKGSLGNRSEKLAAQKKRYTSKQIECVVCLEEYVDGQSRVMRLPCGHEFHVECITPWLTTRRRTCPICKGDVVRSPSSTSSDSTPTRSRSFESLLGSDGVQMDAMESTNDLPSAAIPIPSGAGDGDLERGDDDMAETLVNDGPGTLSLRGGWRELVSRSLSAVSGDGSTQQAREDRAR